MVEEKFVPNRVDDPLINWQNHKTCIFGVQESGKTFLAQDSIKNFKKPLVFVVNTDDEWEKVKRCYVVQCKDRLNHQEEFKKFIKGAYRLARERKIDAIYIDEADLFIQTNWDITPELNDLVLNHRHISDDKKYGVALILMTRRPQDIPTKIVESSKNLIVFPIEGSNAMQKFKEINPKIVDCMNQLQYGSYDYVFKTIGSDPVVCNAIKIS